MRRSSQTVPHSRCIGEGGRIPVFGTFDTGFGPRTCHISHAIFSSPHREDLGSLSRFTRLRGFENSLEAKTPLEKKGNNWCLLIFSRLRDAAVGVHECFLTLELLGTLHLTKKTIDKHCDSAPGLLFKWARDVRGPNCKRGRPNPCYCGSRISMSP